MCGMRTRLVFIFTLIWTLSCLYPRKECPQDARLEVVVVTNLSIKNLVPAIQMMKLIPWINFFPFFSVMSFQVRRIMLEYFQKKYLMTSVIVRSVSVCGMFPAYTGQVRASTWGTHLACCLSQVPRLQRPAFSLLLFREFSPPVSGWLLQVSIKLTHNSLFPA